ncbi:response regulator [Qipengyuania sp. XHP0211]|uniref:response regulator n=1 Tax=Qipengyuania sp. XHP0211 TaxID=3038079 RepID=UPI00241F6FCE|nr:response regulator [Qipengyuania sp. XHP0211]MDG5752057.1 response regulator [Qipengyuania sp. XHP0211]
MYEPKSASWTDKRVSKDESPDGAAGALRVLLAEDTQISADVLMAMTRHLSVQMDHATNGVEAIAMIKTAENAAKPYSMLLLDVNMPILDGVETAKRLRAQGYDAEYLPIIAVTAATDLDEVRTYRAAGMQAYLEKPVALDDLRATLRAWGHRTRNTPQRKRSAALEALKLRFDDRTLGLLRQIDGALDRSDIDEALIMELRNLLHQLAGTAGSFGQPRLGEVARNQEAALLAAFFAGEDVKPVLENAKSALKAEL